MVLGERILAGHIETVTPTIEGLVLAAGFIDKNGVIKIPFVVHKANAGKGISAGTLGLPSETRDIITSTGKHESLTDTQNRLFQEELGIDISSVPFMIPSVTPIKHEFSYGGSLAHAYVVAYLTPFSLLEFKNPKLLDTNEIEDVVELPIHLATNPPPNVTLRSTPDSKEILTALVNRGIFNLQPHAFSYPLNPAFIRK